MIPPSTARSTAFNGLRLDSEVPSPGPSNVQLSEALITVTPSSIIQSVAVWRSPFEFTCDMYSEISGAISISDSATIVPWSLPTSQSASF